MEVWCRLGREIVLRCRITSVGNGREKVLAEDWKNACYPGRYGCLSSCLSYGMIVFFVLFNSFVRSFLLLLHKHLIPSKPYFIHYPMLWEGVTRVTLGLTGMIVSYHTGISRRTIQRVIEQVSVRTYFLLACTHFFLRRKLCSHQQILLSLFSVHRQFIGTCFLFIEMFVFAQGNTSVITDQANPKLITKLSRPVTKCPEHMMRQIFQRWAIAPPVEPSGSVQLMIIWPNPALTFITGWAARSAVKQGGKDVRDTTSSQITGDSYNTKANVVGFSILMLRLPLMIGASWGNLNVSPLKTTLLRNGHWE